ncbi:unnamed protein product [Rhizoctonia solani]|uniref:HhH-GPD domain-containing protein n=1 Tax=Rhizoctonia solani TaxID=456999 RepID=A0A8H3HN71_9AGAM|nr:unnamed protein product [Rhizoctonia solani]
MEELDNMPGSYENTCGGKTPLTTSPYFASAKTPPLKRVTDQDGEIESAGGMEARRKRQRVTLRELTPSEHRSPPSSPEELSRALRTIKPTLIQERICSDPWKMIVATTLLNKTNGKAAIPIFWELIRRWPTPTALAQASAPTLTELLRPLGTQSVRTSRLIRLSNAYVMHPPVIPPQPRPTSGNKVDGTTLTISQGTVQYSPISSRKGPIGKKVICMTDEAKPIQSCRISPKEYRTTQNKSPIAYLPFTGSYAIDSFRIFSSALNGGGAGARVEEQLERIAHLTKPDQHSSGQDDFDETPSWYNPIDLYVTGDDDAEWRKVWPEDKQLRRYLVWRWAIEGVEYDPEAKTRCPADWTYLNGLIRR